MLYRAKRFTLTLLLLLFISVCAFAGPLSFAKQLKFRSCAETSLAQKLLLTQKTDNSGDSFSISFYSGQNLISVVNSVGSKYQLAVDELESSDARKESSLVNANFQDDMNNEDIMQIKKIETSNALSAIGPYSQALCVGDFIYLSGQIGLDPKTGTFVEGSVREQTEQALKNIEEVLKAAGSSMSKVVKTTVFIVDMDDFATVNEVYSKAFECCEVFPARSCVEVSKLPKGGLVEIEVVAVK